VAARASAREKLWKIVMIEVYTTEGALQSKGGALEGIADVEIQKA
jgi:hypothetical protein